GPQSRAVIEENELSVDLRVAPRQIGPGELDVARFTRDDVDAPEPNDAEDEKSVSPQERLAIGHVVLELEPGCSGERIDDSEVGAEEHDERERVREEDPLRRPAGVPFVHPSHHRLPLDRRNVEKVGRSTDRLPTAPCRPAPDLTPHALV